MAVNNMTTGTGMGEIDDNDAINPNHYKSHPSGIQCIEISKHLSGCLAQAFQYVWRCGKKDDPIQELKKALWFIDAELSIDNDLLSIQPESVLDIVNSKIFSVLKKETNISKKAALSFISSANFSGIIKRHKYLIQAKNNILEMIEEYAAN